MGDHADTYALITGGTQGLGLAIAERLIAEGCQHIVVSGRSASKGERAVSQLRVHCADAHFIATDLGDAAAVKRLIVDAVDRLGHLTALVNSGASTARGSILDTTPAAFDSMMAVNTRGPFFAIQGFATHCIARGKGGGVVNIQSNSVHVGPPELAGYSASKAALQSITKNSAHALREHRIRVNGINVGWMDTPAEDEVQRGFHGRSEGWLREAEAKEPFGSLVKPHQVARQVALFLSETSGVVTGAVLDWDQHIIGAFPLA